MCPTFSPFSQGFHIKGVEKKMKREICTFQKFFYSTINAKMDMRKYILLVVLRLKEQEYANDGITLAEIKTLMIVILLLSRSHLRLFMLL